ncbi:MAG TPA: hypothetical protein VN151_10350 [Terracidiphilus sp.]|nr:hypothetical protein [Terracidiphilus sp.]
MIPGTRFKASLVLAFCAPLVLTACRKEQQAVAGVAQKAANAEHKAQAAASLRDQQRAALESIPLPTKSLYVDIHEPSAWANPFLTVEAGTIDLRIIRADANPSKVGQGTMLRPSAARRQELQIRPDDLVRAIVALPAGAWPYGRVIAIAESPTAPPKDRPQIRRNVEAAIQQLNDIGIVVQEWPSR